MWRPGPLDDLLEKMRFALKSVGFIALLATSVGFTYLLIKVVWRFVQWVDKVALHSPW